MCPIPLFLHKATGELHARSVELMEEVAQRIEQEGIEAWFKLDPAELLGTEAADYDKVTDTPSMFGLIQAPRIGMCCAARTH